MNRTTCPPSPCLWLAGSCRRFLVLLALCATGLNNANSAAQTLESHFVSMDDGVRLAADVHFPAMHTATDRRPTMLELTRYWRSTIDPKTGQPLGSGGVNRIDREFLANGYIVVKVDVRGSGASFGKRLEEYGPREVRDGYAIIDWVAKQPWSDGNVGAYGISYSGTTAEFICSSKHPALKAVIPGWSDFDDFASPSRPYGLFAKSLIDEWGMMVGWMDENNVEKMGGSVRPVEPNLLGAAIADHASNPDVAEFVAHAEYRDFAEGGARPMSECSSVFWKHDIEASNVPMLVFASWLDAGTADGALLRFQHYRNPQYLVILASSHGGAFHASPYAVGESAVPPIPGRKEQLDLWLAFANHYLKGEDNEVTRWPQVRYFNMGEEKIRETAAWPPDGVSPQAFYFSPDGLLKSQPPNVESACDKYDVDFGVTTGASNRWMTQMGRPILNLDRRESMDARMLCYTSAPLNHDVQITGTPEVHLWLSSNLGDGAVLVYLEDVAPDGQSRYVTEGGLRFVHRKLTVDPKLPRDVLPHSFAEADALPLEPDSKTEVAFKMWPTSVNIAKGHQIRIAVAGADQTTFARLPDEGDVTLTVFRQRDSVSHVVLPIAGE